jgi:hypothetical protein
MGKSTPRGTPGPSHGRARELGVRASSAARPSHPRARPRRVQVAAMRCEAEGKSEYEEGRETDEWAPLVSESEEKKKRWRLVRLRLRLRHGLGRRVRGKGRIRPMLFAKALQTVLKLALS